MKTMLMVLVCGTTITLAAAVQPANQPDRRPGNQPTQPTQPNQPGRPGNPLPNQPSQPGQPGDTTRPGQPTDRDRIPAINRSTTGQPDALLRRLEGTWKVDVTVSPEFLAEHGKPQMRTPADRSSTPTDPNRPSNPTDRDNNNPSRTNNDPSRTVPDQNNQPGSIKSTSGFSGFAQTRLIMNGQILEETVRIPQLGMSGDMNNTTDNNRSTTTPRDNDRDPSRPSGINNDRPGQPGTQPGSQPGTTPSQPADRDTIRGITPGMDSGAMVGRMFLAFDEGSRTYTAVFMDSRSGMIHTDRGTFDATANRITFHGSADDDMKDSRPGSTTTNHAGMSGMHDVRIVLELSGDDRHTVTMYRSGGTSGTGISTPPGNPNDPNSTPSNQPGSTTRDANGTMFYRATYTRLSGTDVDRARDSLRDDSDRLGTDRTGTDRNNDRTPGGGK